ncbi:MAG: LON peptidase substrate-binding domain-containing protein [Planctomycetes bacterium]|nr:LON peptidase substrate-binding domain-containing protein [Planctomycetota bacterium]
MDDDLPELAYGIPVFPLPAMVLLPHTNLPLHIFEERYRNLMEDTLGKPESQHCFAMGTLLEESGDATLGDPPVSRYAGVGRVTEYSRAPDGRYMLVLHGVGRVRLTHEMSMVRGYRLFGGEWIRDVLPHASRTWERNLSVELKGLALALLREQAEKFRGLLSDDIELGVLTDMVTGYLPFPPEFKLRQMSTPNVIERAAGVISQLEKMIGLAPDKPLHLDDAPPVN